MRNAEIIEQAMDCNAHGENARVIDALLDRLLYRGLSDEDQDFHATTLRQRVRQARRGH